MTPDNKHECREEQEWRRRQKTDGRFGFFSRNK